MMSASPHFPGLPAGWKEEILSFADGQLSMRIWSNPSGQRGRGLYIVHGFGEQSNRYLHFAHYLHTSVDVIAAIDLPGHGLSKGGRGHCEDFADIKKAALAGFHFFQQWISKNFGRLDLHWFGHSFGGLTTLALLGEHRELPLRSMIVSAPELALAFPVPKVKKFLGELIEPLLPRLPLGNELDNTTLSRDPSVGVEYRRDPLNHSKITPRMFKRMTGAMEAMVAWNGTFNYNLLLILPLNDRIVNAGTTLRAFQSWKMTEGKKKEISMWPGSEHETFNDLDKAQAFNALENWIQKN